MVKTLPVKTLFDNDVRDYSIYANYRAIPNVMDGFKTSQRKVIYGTLKQVNSIPETGVKVSQLASSISAISHYHHGEVSLEGAIVNMAQDFAGSNNVNYLVPEGQFGNRQSSLAASSRYIYTKLATTFRELFKVADDIILENLLEDGEQIEPKMYMPILPNVLINGAEGMGTGFACLILQYSPQDLKEHILALLANKQPKTLLPWFRDFAGKVERMPTGQVVMTGKFERINSTTLKITELPIGVFIDQYKAHLLNLEDAGYIKDWTNNSSEKKFEFTLTVPRTTSYDEDEVLLTKLKLISKVKENLTVWKAEGDRLKCFDSPETLVKYFVEERLKLYEKRRLKQIELLQLDQPVLEERVKFIKYFIANAQQVTDFFRTNNKQEVIKHLQSLGYVNATDHVELRLYTLTADAIEALEAKLTTLKLELTKLQSTTAKEIYVIELTTLDAKKLTRC